MRALHDAEDGAAILEFGLGDAFVGTDADGELPTAVIDFINADGKRIPDPQVTVRFGERCAQCVPENRRQGAARGVNCRPFGAESLPRRVRSRLVAGDGPLTLELFGATMRLSRLLARRLLS